MWCDCSQWNARRRGLRKLPLVGPWLFRTVWRGGLDSQRDLENISFPFPGLWTFAGGARLNSAQNSVSILSIRNPSATPTNIRVAVPQYLMAIVFPVIL